MSSSSLFRSEEMCLVQVTLSSHSQLYIPLEISQQTVAELGELGQIEFRDLNPDVNAFQRTFVNEIRRLDEMERKIRMLRLALIPGFLYAQAEKASVRIKPVDTSAPFARARTFQELSEIETQLGNHESRILQMNNSKETLSKRLLELTELKHVLKETATFFDEVYSFQHSSPSQNESRMDDRFGNNHREDSHLLSGGAQDYGFEAIERGEAVARDSSLGFVAGIIPRTRMATFERIMFRALRGNLYLNYAEVEDAIKDPSTEAEIKKNVFIIFAHGKELLGKIRKICESLNATIYPVDDNREKRRENSLEVLARIEDLNHVLYNTNVARKTELLSASENLELWATIVKKEKATYHTMNLFNYDVNRKALIAEGWCPTNALNSVTYCLRTVTVRVFKSDIQERTNSTIPPLLNELRTPLKPPTYHRTNKFSNGFQEIVDAYGVATYREVNPGLFTIVTFPFLFAVMFGDLGHGFIVTLFASWMCYYEKSLSQKKWGEIWATFFGGRYIILLMGIFSIYTGLIYNDIFSQAMTLFRTAYVFTFDKDSGKFIGHKDRWYPYVIGVDPAWHGAENSLLFSNSYKMKMAIVFGVMQMTFGVVLSLYNHRYFKRPLNIYTEFIPQIIFLESIFGYLVILIIYKWMFWTDRTTAPGLLNTLIYMFLRPGVIEMPLYPGQGVVQVILLLIAFLCVPWMLLVKPYILYQNSKKAHIIHSSPDRAASPTTSDIDSSAGLLEMSHEHEEEHFEFGEVMIHQMIHTIEFCLGAISNTASYLRLWALSLAHAQLSEVLWTMVLANGLTATGAIAPIAMVIAFAAWFVLTVGILIGMEGLSAFLHALRLHWVEFQNKFYEGAGKKFEPFAFSTILQDAPEE